MNPVPVMKLIEVIRGLQTSNETLAITNKYLMKFRKNK
jgi:3-hydroxyacyl-CoA dehydrogenase